jgi:hypothetical protein
MEGVLDAAGDRVDRSAYSRIAFRRAVFAPRSDVGNRLAADVGPTEAETMYATVFRRRESVIVCYREAGHDNLG